MTSYLSTLFLLYLTISGNFLGELFNCRVQHILRTNPIVKHLIGMLTLYFFIALTEASDNEEPADHLKKTLKVYGVFLLSTKMDPSVWMVLFGIMIASHVLSIWNKTRDDKQPIWGSVTIEKLITWLDRFAMVLVVIGVLAYAGEKRGEYGKDFQWRKFFITSDCKGDTAPALVSKSIGEKIALLLK